MLRSLAKCTRSIRHGFYVAEVTHVRVIANNTTFHRHEAETCEPFAPIVTRAPESTHATFDKKMKLKVRASKERAWQTLVHSSGCTHFANYEHQAAGSD